MQRSCFWRFPLREWNVSLLASDCLSASQALCVAYFSARSPWISVSLSSNQSWWCFFKTSIVSLAAESTSSLSLTQFSCVSPLQKVTCARRFESSLCRANTTSGFLVWLTPSFLRLCCLARGVSLSQFYHWYLLLEIQAAKQGKSLQQNQLLPSFQFCNLARKLYNLTQLHLTLLCLRILFHWGRQCPRCIVWAPLWLRQSFSLVGWFHSIQKSANVPGSKY